MAIGTKDEWKNVLKRHNYALDRNTKKGNIFLPLSSCWEQVWRIIRLVSRIQNNCDNKANIILFTAVFFKKNSSKSAKKFVETMSQKDGL